MDRCTRLFHEDGVTLNTVVSHALTTIKTLDWKHRGAALSSHSFKFTSHIGKADVGA